MKFLMLIVYLSSGQPIMEKAVFDTKDECISAGKSRLEAIGYKIDDLLIGSCFLVPGQKVEASGRSNQLDVPWYTVPQGPTWFLTVEGTSKAEVK